MGKNINFGCGTNFIVGWENYDTDIDVTKPLPFDDYSTDLIFSEHLLEHLNIHEAFNFLEECYRILKVEGAVKIIVPTITKINPDDLWYFDFVKQCGFGPDTFKGAIKSLIYNHGHKSLWDEKLLLKVLQAIGFNAYISDIYNSTITEFVNIAGHDKVIGKGANNIESISVEAIKK